MSDSSKILKQQDKQIGRASNIELLRILCMLCIVAHHYSVHGKFSFDTSIVSMNRVLVQILSLGGKLGVNCFVLITGYFSCKNSQFRWKGIIKFFIQVTIFSIVIYCISWATSASEFGIKSLLCAVCPLIWGGWWFASTYFVLILFSPFINKFILSVPQKSLLSVIILMGFLWPFMNTFLKTTMQCSNLTWFVFLYLFAAYIRLYSPRFFNDQRIQIALFILATSIIVGSVLVFDILGTRYGFFASHALYFSSTYKLPLVLQSVTLFCLFKNLKLKDSKLINFIAAAMFGVYLIHDHSLSRPFLWVNIFKNATFQDSPYLIVHALVAIAVVFVVSTCVSVLYNVTIGRLIDKCVGACLARIEALEIQSNKWVKKAKEGCEKYFM